MTSAASDTYLAEFTALRAEILTLKRVEATVVTAALTILAAVGGFALSKKDGRLEALLVLPVVLSGLGLLQLRCIDQADRISLYIRDHLWTRLSHASTGEFMSWEHFISSYRHGSHRLFSVYAAIGILPRILIFAVPSVAALVITHRQWDARLAALWWSGALAVLAFGALALSLSREPKGAVPGGGVE